MPLFSIIVPVYNAEKTLYKCLNSILVQTAPDFEVLLVENGSDDFSNRICCEYAEKDARFRLFTCEENKGPSGARNIGLSHASGEIVTFVDSDDFVEPDYLENLCHAFQLADVVFFGYRQISIAGSFLGEYIPSISDNSGYYETLLQLYQQDMFGYTWIKAFRRSIIGEQRFSMELNLLEDEVFTCQILSEQRRVAVINRPLYNYVTGNTGSLIGRTHPDYCRKVDTAYNAWKVLLKDYSQKEKALIGQANAHVRRCMYYGFERDVDVKDFFSSLRESDFFREADGDDVFYECVKTGNDRKLSCMRNIYRMKVKIAKLLKR